MLPEWGRAPKTEPFPPPVQEDRGSKKVGTQGLSRAHPCKRSGKHGRWELDIHALIYFLPGLYFIQRTKEVFDAVVANRKPFLSRGLPPEHHRHQTLPSRRTATTCPRQCCTWATPQHHRRHRLDHPSRQNAPNNWTSTRPIAPRRTMDSTVHQTHTVFPWRGPP